MATARIELPPKLVDVFTGPARYRGAYGGRGSGKTRSFALMTAVRAYGFAMEGRTGAILCGREFMASLSDSSMEEIKLSIRSQPWLDAFFEIGETFIRSRCGRVWYTFTGLRYNLDSIKGKAPILLAWVDEAENVSDIAWNKLGPTVREPGSEIWVTWNPEKDGSPTDERFRKQPRTGAKIVELNYSDNPWFPPELEQERLDDRATMSGADYAWIWEGAYRENSEAQVFAGKYRVDEFAPAAGWSGPYYGLDFGFSQDPTAANCCWVHDGFLYIEHEASKTGLDIDKTAPFVTGKMPDMPSHVVRADSSRPESISYLKRHGLPRIEAVHKWPGSVEDGIAHIRGYKAVIIHPRCVETIKEFRLYSYAVDRLSGDVLPDVIDKHNHHIDAIRYAIQPLIAQPKKRAGVF